MMFTTTKEREDKVTELCVRLFGKPISEMDKNEILSAMSILAGKLAVMTGEERFKRVERATLSALNGSTAEQMLEDAYNENYIVKH